MSIDNKTINKLEQVSVGTEAYWRLRSTILKIENLLGVSLRGLDVVKEHHDSLLAKFKNAENDPDTILDDDEAPFLKKNENGNYTFRMNKSDLKVFQNAMEFSRKEHDDLDKYIYSILVVFIWGAFETYLNQAFSEVFRVQPSILKNNNVSFTSSDIIDNINDPLELIINKEIDKIGHFKLKDWAKYLKNNIKLDFDETFYNELSGIYLVRNIVAHNTGIVRADQLDKIPNDLSIQDGEIVVSEQYLKKSLKSINKAVKDIETVIREKFYKNKQLTTTV